MPRNEGIAGLAERVCIAPWSITETRLRSKKKQVDTLAGRASRKRISVSFLPRSDEWGKKVLNLTVCSV